LVAFGVAGVAAEQQGNVVAPPIVALAMAPEGDVLLAASQAGVTLNRLPSLEPMARLDVAMEMPLGLAFSPDGQWLAIVGGAPAQQGQIEVWRWGQRQCVARVRAGEDTLQTVCWSPDGRQLIVAGDDRSVQSWRWMYSAAGAVLERAAVWYPHSAGVTCAVWLPSEASEGGGLLTAGMDHTLRQIAPATGRTVLALDHHTAAVRDLAVEPCSQAAAGAAGGPAHAVFPPGGPLVASASADRTVRFWQPQIGRLVRFARLPSAPTAIAWTPDGRRVLAACEDGHLRSVDRGSVQVADLGSAIAGWAYAVVVTADGKLAIVGGEGGRLNRLPLATMMNVAPE
jgi:WD40 repeat protein